ncbi:MAG TPA: MotA/TolQ/ExbB proton channel family protein [Myxococcales bacterium]|nr:MotA/TolQ/ExbB proton channel family protein [Myxococcales bacterium]
MNFDEILHYLRLGGVTIAVILAASVISLGVAIERLIALWGASQRSRNLSQAISKHLLRGDVGGARSAAERSKAVAADIFLAGFDRLDRSGQPHGSLESAVARERAEVLLRLKRNLWVLGTIGATAPFVGLFGTVAGIMRSFRDLGVDVAAGGVGGSAKVMTGISEALIATAVGIVVAVEAVVLYNYFQARLARLAVELRLIAEEFIELLRGPPMASAPQAPPPAPAPAPAVVPDARPVTEGS